MNFVGDEDYTEYSTAWNKIGPIIFKEQENVSKRKKQGIKGNNDGAENNEIMIPFLVTCPIRSYSAVWKCVSVSMDIPNSPMKRPLRSSPGTQQIASCSFNV